jgi:uncharacterized protein YjbI with pentapeptide repeats
MQDLSNFNTSESNVSKVVSLENPTALRQTLDLKLALYQAKVSEIELGQQGRLQLSVSSFEVPNQSTLEPLLQKWLVQFGLVNVSMVELYGQKDGSELPYWRSSFNLKDIDLDKLATIPQPERIPTGFIDPLQVDLTDLNKNGKVLEPIAPPIVSESTTPPAAMDSEQKTKAVKDFLSRYAAGERDFSNIDLSETDLSGVNLTLANLHNAKLTWANLKGANLYHIDLGQAKLRHANLSGSMLRSSNLQGTDFLNANLSGADLSWSNLNGANLTGADLTDANLKNAILERVILPDGTFLD